MATYEVLIEARGIAVPIDDGRVAKGFFATRTVAARTQAEAEARALAMVKEEIAGGRAGRGAEGATLQIEEATRVSFVKRLILKNRGYAFYVAE